jgi:hypothetical protein
MGGAVAGVLGGVQLVSGIVGSSSSAKAQAAATNSQIQSSVDAARIRQIEILQQKDNAGFVMSMNNLGRQQEYQNAVYAVKYQQQKESIDAQSVQSKANEQLLQSLAAAEISDTNLGKQSSEANISRQRVLQDVANYLTGSEQQANQALIQGGQSITDASQRSGMRQAMYAQAGVSGNSQSSQQQSQVDVMDTLSKYAQLLSTTQTGRQLSQMIGEVTTSGSKAEQDAKLAEISGYLKNNDLQRTLSQQQYNDTVVNLSNQQSLNSAARDSSLAVLGSTNNINKRTEDVNQQLANAGYSVQNTANNSLLGNQIATAAAQYNPQNQFLSLLNSGASAYNVYQQASAQQSFLGKK